MSKRVNIIRLLAAAILVIAQAAMAAGPSVAAAPSPTGETIVICTPNGLKLITLGPDGEVSRSEAPTEETSPLCPLCALAKAMKTPSSTAPARAVAPPTRINFAAHAALRRPIAPRLRHRVRGPPA